MSGTCALKTALCPDLGQSSGSLRFLLCTEGRVIGTGPRGGGGDALESEAQKAQLRIGCVSDFVTALRKMMHLKAIQGYWKIIKICH